MAWKFDTLWHALNVNTFQLMLAAASWQTQPFICKRAANRYSIDVSSYILCEAEQQGGKSRTGQVFNKLSRQFVRIMIKSLTQLCCFVSLNKVQ